jgi:hypothetical protein
MFRTIVAATAFVLAFAGLASAATAPTCKPGKTVTVKMNAQNGSGETGTATLTQEATGVRVVVALTGAPSGVAQPTHIHMGTCAKLDPKPAYPLTSTLDGKSTTLVKGLKLSALLAGHYAVNVHKSGSDLKTYVSCGDIVTGSSSM